MKIYIHTLNGQPAAFDGNQVCYAWSSCHPAYSLKQIRREQKHSMQWRASNGLDDHFKYGYRLYAVEREQK